MSDEDLIQQVRNGHTDAFGELVDGHVRHLRTFIALRAPVTHLIEEITHEAFVFAYRNLDDFQTEGNFAAWIRSIAANLLRAEKQRWSRDQANRTKYAHSHVFNVTQNKDPEKSSREIDFLRSCLAHLPEKSRHLLALKYESTNTSQEIAAQVGKSVAWVRTTLFRLRNRLQACVEQKLFSGESVR